jgi:hypothetical protein
MKVAEKILEFIKTLHLPVSLPAGVMVMNPFRDALTLEYCDKFYRKFYSDTHNRWMIIGINPGRFGGGITGIPFTDPVRLQNDAGVVNSWPKKQELSSVFIYEMIRAFGGAQTFYQHFYFTAVSPLGFTKNNKNLNYYDDSAIQDAVKDFVVECLVRQLEFGINRQAAFCLGEGKNFRYLSKLNDEMKIFDRIIPLSHPRFIMQYRLKQKEAYIKYYLEQFQLFVNNE